MLCLHAMTALSPSPYLGLHHVAKCVYIHVTYLAKIAGAPTHVYVDQLILGSPEDINGHN